MDTKTCLVTGCNGLGNKHGNKRYLTRGYCLMHYTRLRNHGTLYTKDKIKNGEALEYFNIAMKIKTDVCMFWPFSRDINGYGQIWDGRMSIRAHRYALIHKEGLPPANKNHACHKCDNPACFNPEHLYWGSAKENAADRKRKPLPSF